MNTRYECFLDGMPLSSVEACVAVVDIRERPPELAWSTARPAQGEGTLVLDTRCVKREVEVSFCLRDRRPDRRTQALEEVLRWCRGSRLEISTRPGRFLRVRCVQWPSVDSALRWPDSLCVTFAAWEVPFWQDVRQTHVALSGTGSASGTLYAPGTATEAPLSVRLKNVGSAACDAVTLTAGETQLHFTGLGLGAGAWLLVGQDERDRLTLLVEDATGAQRSVMACRTGASSDLLALPCGSRGAVGLTIAQAFEVDFCVRGRWL